MPAPALREEPPARAEQRADGDGELHVARAGEPSHRSAVRTALHAFQLVDDLHRADLGRPAQGARRVGRRERIDRAEARLQQAAHLAGHVHHVAEPLGLHQPLDPHAANAADPADVVAAEISTSMVCSARSLGSARRSASSRRSSSGDAPRRRVPAIGRSVIFPAATSTSNSGDAPNSSRPPKSQVEMIGRRAGRAQRAVERKTVAVGQLESLAQDHLEDIAGADVFERAPHRGLELLFAAAHRNRLGQAALQQARAVALIAEEPRAQRLRGRRPQRAGKEPLREALQDARGQRLRALGSALPVRDRPGPPLPVIEGDVLAHAQQVRIGKERVRPEPLRKPLGPARGRPPEESDVSAAERRQDSRRADRRPPRERTAARSEAAGPAAGARRRSRRSCNGRALPRRGRHRATDPDREGRRRRTASADHRAVRRRLERLQSRLRVKVFIHPP